MLQRLYFALRIWLKPFGRAGKKKHLKFYSEMRELILSTLPKGATELCCALRKGFSRIRKTKWRRGSTKNVYIFVHTPLSELIYICADLTSQDLSYDTKFSPPPFNNLHCMHMLLNKILIKFFFHSITFAFYCSLNLKK